MANRFDTILEHTLKHDSFNLIFVYNTT